jgi:hypothetical protein
MSSGPWGTLPTSAVGRTATWYMVLYCTVTFGTLCINIIEVPELQIMKKGINGIESHGTTKNEKNIKTIKIH